jgi:hypothetical protein
MRALAALLGSLALVLGVAPAVQAKQYTHNDRVGDTLSFYDQEPYEVSNPAHTHGDITRVQIKHNKHYVQLFMTFRSLGVGDDRIAVHFNVQNGRRQVRHVAVRVAPTGVWGLEILNAGYKDVTCRGTRGAGLNTTSRLLAVTVPRTCFGKPKVIRLNANAEGDDHVRERVTYVDDALTSGYPSAPYNYQSPVVWTPWVRRH